jgi:hypothetical protein
MTLTNLTLGMLCITCTMIVIGALIDRVRNRRGATPRPDSAAVDDFGEPFGPTFGSVRPTLATPRTGIAPW